MRLLGLLTLVCLMSYTSLLTAQNSPYFVGNNNPKPSNRTWQKLPELSDEFNDSSIDNTKWNTNPYVNSSGTTDGIFTGNPPAIFEQNNVTENNKHLRILAEKFNSAKYERGAWRSYGGGRVDSKKPLKVGYYMEARMRANHTIMSSSFWLMEDKTCEQLNNKRRQEIDIQECIGRTNSKTPNWARFWDRTFHSNVLALGGCGKEEDRDQSSGSNYGQTNRSGFRIYGCWWKSSRELLFYLDGEYQYTLVPPVDFNRNMFYKLSSNLYDWQGTTNNVEDGFELSANKRTTKFDWVRTWKLSGNNDGGGSGGGSGSNWNIVTMRKRNSTGYGLDGGNGGSNRQNVYIWGYNRNNNNQHWVEKSVGNGYYLYKKRGTNYCLDGGNGGGNGQNLYLWSCNNNNQNQHWKKVSVGGGAYRLEKRNASNYSIDGGSGGGNGQNTKLWSSNNNNQNQHWIFEVVGQVRVEQAQDIDLYVYPNPFSSQLTIELPNEVESDAMSVQLIDITGKVVYEKSQLTSEQMLYIREELPNGFYILRWSDEKSQMFATRKVIKQ